MKHSIKVVMLPTEDGNNNPEGFITKCIKEMPRVGETPLSEGTLSLCVNNSIGVLEYRKPHYVYITVSQDVEPIKKGDWFFNSQTNRVILAKVDENVPTSRKIIATDDPKLYDVRENNAPFRRLSSNPKEIQKLFLKEFVANPDGEWKVEYERQWDSLEKDKHYDNTAKYRLKLNQDNTVNITSVEEKMYSREDMIKLANKVYDTFADKYCSKNAKKHFKENWIKENL
jgi:hypothetical protein